MDKMFVRVPVAIKAKVTEDLKLKNCWRSPKHYKNMELDLEQFEFQAKKHCISCKRFERTSGFTRTNRNGKEINVLPLKQTLKLNSKRAEALELGAEIGHGTLERTVEITVGTDRML